MWPIDQNINHEPIGTKDFTNQVPLRNEKVVAKMWQSYRCPSLEVAPWYSCECWIIDKGTFHEKKQKWVKLGARELDLANFVAVVWGYIPMSTVCWITPSSLSTYPASHRLFLDGGVLAFARNFRARRLYQVGSLDRASWKWRGGCWALAETGLLQGAGRVERTLLSGLFVVCFGDPGWFYLTSRISVSWWFEQPPSLSLSPTK